MVRCYDEVHRIWWRGMWPKTILSLVIFFAFTALGSMFHAQWLQAVGVLVIGGTIVIPQIFRIERGYSDQICPACGKRVGRSETCKNRVFLVCQHCATRTPTDCAHYYSGGPPSKVT